MTVIRTSSLARERARELGGYALLFVLLSAAYETMRHFAGIEFADHAQRNARAVIFFERHLGLFIEPRTQSAVSRIPGGEKAVTLIYAYEHLAGSIAFLTWLILAQRARFPFVWRWFWLAHAVALIGFWLYPLAPPRLVPTLHLADPTTAQFGNSPGHGALDRIANDFAAMPSLHFGYALMYAIVGWCVVSPSRARWLVWLWPGLIGLVIVATANHYWLDAVGGAIAVGVALSIGLLLFPDLPRPWDASGSRRSSLQRVHDTT